MKARFSRENRPRAFTLIELLIVVAIIAILAAIAIPNFLEAQTRSKVSKAYADLRTVRTGLEAYAVDTNHYPLDVGAPPNEDSLIALTTPVSYLTSLPGDPFGSPTGAAHASWYDFGSGTSPWATWFAPWRDHSFTYFMVSLGPDSVFNWGAGRPSANQPWTQEGMAIVLSGGDDPDGGLSLGKLYDPTNGTRSDGDLWVTNRGIHNAR